MVVRILDAPDMIYDMRTYAPAYAPDVEAALNRYIDFDKWGERYAHYDRLWLEHDDEDSHDLQHPVNQSILAAIRKANARLRADTQLFYYYDIDRTDERGPEWTHCPLTNRPLVNLGKEAAPHGRLVCFESRLALPDIANQPTP